MKLYDLHFRRRFARNFYRSMFLDLGGMCLTQDFTKEDKRGAPHPVINSSGKIGESVNDGRYFLESDEGGCIHRLIGGFFPYATYSFKLCELSLAEVGFSVTYGGGSLVCTVSSNEKASIIFRGQQILLADAHFLPEDILEFTFRAGGISIYLKRNNVTRLLADVSDSDSDGKIKDISGEGLSSLLNEKNYHTADLCLYANLQKGGKISISDIESKLMCGIAQADIRPMKYEDGTPIYENGRVFLTASERLETGAYQSIISYNPTTADFRMEGALFFDLGDGILANDVASSVIYDRNSEEWYIWFCAFSHGHVLARARLKTDPRHSVSVIDAKAVETKEGSALTDFYGVFGDEDPDLLYKDGKWHLAVCRPENDGYHYYRFVSDNPIDGFVFADRTESGQTTGGSFVNFEGEHYFVCGRSFSERAKYDVYELSDFKTPHPMLHLHDDGGFRGWGSVFGVTVGTRKKYFHVTFDRHLASKKWNWSYGNVYLFEADEYFKQ